MAGYLDDVSICTSTTKSVPRDFSWIENYKLIYYMVWRLLTRFNFSIKILLATITFLFWILLCCLLNMLSFCIANISWCCFVVTFFRCSSHVPLFRGIPIVLPVFGCMFRRCSVFRSSVFWCSWFYSMPSNMTIYELMVSIYWKVVKSLLLITWYTMLIIFYK